MYQMAKTAREKMKAKARALAGEKDRKVDSSDWTPAKPLNASVKTGARPIMKPSAKGIGESNAAADTKAAIGNPTRGAFKSGGAVKDAGVKTKKALGAIDPSPKRKAASHYKKGGRTKKEGGGFLENIGNALMGRGYIDGSTWLKKDEPVTASDTVEKISPAQYAKERAMARQNMRTTKTPRMSKEQASRELAMGRELQRNADIMPGAKSTVQSDRFMKKGGKIKKAGGGSFLEKMVGKPKGSDYSQVGKMGTANYTQEDKGALNKAIKGDDALPAAGEAAERSGKYQNYKKGGRTAKATGGSLISAMKGAAKKSSKKGAKTDINIVINAGKPAPRHIDAGMGRGAPDVMPPPPPPMAAGAAAPAMPPMGPDAGPMLPPGLPIGRKSGGRITKVASSYKDMEAGAVSGEGRLQKTDIAKHHRDAPARKTGGRISKVAKSYKDMTAGAGDGEGRLQKTDIAKAKMGRAK